MAEGRDKGKGTFCVSFRKLCRGRLFAPFPVRGSARSPVSGPGCWRPRPRIRPRVRASVPASPPDGSLRAGGRGAARLPLPGAAFQHQILPAPGFQPLGGDARTAGRRFPLSVRVCNLLLQQLTFPCFVFILLYVLYLWYTHVLYTLIRIHRSGLWVFTVSVTLLIVFKQRFAHVWRLSGKAAGTAPGVWGGHFSWGSPQGFPESREEEVSGRVRDTPNPAAFRDRRRGRARGGPGVHSPGTEPAFRPGFPAAPLEMAGRFGGVLRERP